MDVHSSLKAPTIMQAMCVKQRLNEGLKMKEFEALG